MKIGARQIRKRVFFQLQPTGQVRTTIHTSHCQKIHSVFFLKEFLETSAYFNYASREAFLLLFSCVCHLKKNKNKKPFNLGHFTLLPSVNPKSFGVDLCFPFREMSSCWREEATGQFEAWKLPRPSGNPRGLGISLFETWFPKKKRRQRTPLNPSSPGPAFQGQWFIAISRVKPLPDGALCLSSQMSTGYGGRKPKVSFHLERA